MSVRRFPGYLRESRHSASGFTLIELAVVLVLMSIIFAIAAPQFAGRIRVARLHAAGADVQTLASSARARAVLGGEAMAVNIISDGRVLTLSRAEPRGDDDTVTIGPERRLPVGVRASFVPQSEGAPNELTFRPDGSASGGVLRIVMRGSGEMALRLHEPLGRLRPVSGEPS